MGERSDKTRSGGALRKNRCAVVMQPRPAGLSCSAGGPWWHDTHVLPPELGRATLVAWRGAPKNQGISGPSNTQRLIPSGTGSHSMLHVHGQVAVTQKTNHQVGALPNTHTGPIH